MNSHWTPPASINAADSVLRYGGNPNPGSNPAPAAPVSAASTVHLFGGHRGGNKRRKDGLCAGSPEALAADREKDKLRKQRSRAAARAAVYYPVTPGTSHEAQTGLSAFAPPATDSKVPLLVLGFALVALIAEHVALCRKLDQSIFRANPSPRKPFPF